MNWAELFGCCRKGCLLMKRKVENEEENWYEPDLYENL